MNQRKRWEKNQPRGKKKEPNSIRRLFSHLTTASSLCMSSLVPPPPTPTSPLMLFRLARPPIPIVDHLSLFLFSLKTHHPLVDRWGPSSGHPTPPPPPSWFATSPSSSPPFFLFRSPMAFYVSHTHNHVTPPAPLGTPVPLVPLVEASPPPLSCPPAHSETGTVHPPLVPTCPPPSPTCSSVEWRVCVD